MNRKFNRPRVGDVWAFGDINGRRVQIDRIAAGLAGKWFGGKHVAGPKRRLYVHAKGAAPLPVAEWMRVWVFCSPGWTDAEEIRRINMKDLRVCRKRLAEIPPIPAKDREFLEKWAAELELKVKAAQ